METISLIVSFYIAGYTRILHPATSKHVERLWICIHVPYSGGSPLYIYVVIIYVWSVGNHRHTDGNGPPESTGGEPLLRTC